MTAAPTTPVPVATAAAARTGVEQSLEHLLESLLELGICASDVQDTALEHAQAGAATGLPGGLIGRKATQTIEGFAKLHSIRDTVRDVLIPLEVISSVDQGRNPHLFTKDFIERLAGENMYTNGILSAVKDYRDDLTHQLELAFPDLAPFLNDQHSSFAPHGFGHGSRNGDGAQPAYDDSTTESDVTAAGENRGVDRMEL